MIETFAPGMIVRTVVPLDYRSPVTNRVRKLKVGTVLVISETFGTSVKGGYTRTADGACVALIGSDVRPY